MGGRSNGSFLEETAKMFDNPLGKPRIAEQPRHHGSSAKYTHDPMAEGYRPGEVYRSCGTVPRTSPRSPRSFLVVS